MIDEYIYICRGEGRREGGEKWGGIMGLVISIDRGRVELTLLYQL